MEILERIAEPARLRHQLSRLAARWTRASGSRHPEQRGVPLRHLALRPEAVVRHVRAEVLRGDYVPEPARIRRAVLDKPRDLYVLGALDLLVHGAFASVLNELMEPVLSPGLYSYRRGRSSWTAVTDFTAYVRKHRQTIDDVQSRGLFVLRADVREYGDTIGMEDGDPLWNQLADVLHLGLSDRSWPLVRTLVRPHVIRPNGTEDHPVAGVPTGSPVATALNNLHLRELDERLTGVEGGFYARFSDDILFAHPHAGAVRAARTEAEATLARLGLRLNQDKARVTFFNGAGRPTSEWPEARGGSTVEYLGASIQFRGTVGLASAARREVLRDVRRRIERARRLLARETPEERGHLLCRSVNEALDPRREVATPLAPLLFHAVSDRAQLQDLDYWIARAVSTAISGTKGARTFRSMPYRRLRSEWGLRSLVAARNGCGRTPRIDS